MKKPKRRTSSYSYFRDVKIHVAAGLVLASISATVAFAWNTNNRVTTLETALISITQDIHDIKGILMKNQEAVR